jgi:alanine dehydrogenase
MKTSKELLSALTQRALMPQEDMLEIARKRGDLYIGIPKEIAFQENRIAIVPDAVALLVNSGHRVLIESGAGKNANFQDSDYSEAGAEIAYSPEAVYKANIILKVALPLLSEVELMHENQTLICMLQLTVQPKEFLRKLSAKKITAIAFEWIKDEEDIYTVVRSMGEIAGCASILVAAEYLSNVNQGQGSLLGGMSGISPPEVVIIGAGSVATSAARAALGLGNTVKVFDNSVSRLRRLQKELGARVFTSVVQPRVLAKHLKSADVVIGAVRGQKGRAPLIVTEAMVSKMKAGSVIIDLSIDQGGCVETSEMTNHTNPIFRKYGVIHYCVPNIASRVSRTASYALSTIFTPILLEIGEEGGIKNMLRRNDGVRNGIYLYRGILTNKVLGDMFKMPYKDINLLMAGM